MVDISLDRVVSASPVVLYDLISDVTRMGEWSPETTSCRWQRGFDGPVVGARYRGKNRRGLFRWTTSCTVLVADRGSHFAFGVRYGPMPMARWDYRFEPHDEGCLVTESWTELRPRWMSRLDPLVFRIADRGKHNRHTMDVTLARLADHAGTLHEG
jgi:hypothetical protein